MNVSSEEVSPARRFLRRLGVDKGIVFYFLARGSQLAAVPVTMLLVTTRFTPEVQGYYYTMVSLIVFQMIADMGFPTTLTQFVSHEWAHLSLVEGKVTGAPEAIVRLASLIQLAAKWAVLMSLVVAGVLFGAGFYFLAANANPGGVHWQGPWAGLCAAIAVGLLGSIQLGITNGCGRVALGQKILLSATLAANFCTWIAILAGAQLYALVLLQGINAVVTLGGLTWINWPVLKLGLSGIDTSAVRWHGQFWTQQWRIGLSWLSYVGINMSFTPFIFHYQGAVEAGRVGLIVQIYGFAVALAGAWATTAMPKFGALWAHDKREELQQLTRRLVIRSFLTGLAMGLCAVLALLFIKTFLPGYGQRFGTVEQACLLLLAGAFQQIWLTEATAVRFSKSEPFLVMSLTGAALVLTSNAVLGQIGVVAEFCGFLAITVGVLVPWAHAIYRRKVSRGGGPALEAAV